MIDARYAALTRSLGLTANDLAEIGGFSDRFARDLIAGRKPFPKSVCQALADLENDGDVIMDEIIADVQEGQGVIWVFHSTAALRKYYPDWPGRGHSVGGFAGPHCIAALAAREQLSADGIDVEMYFHDP